MNDPLSGAWGGGRTDGAAARGEVGSCGPPQASELSAAARRRVPPSPPGVGENRGFLAGGRREPTNPTRKRIERLRRIRRPESGFGAGLGRVRPTGGLTASGSGEPIAHVDIATRARIRHSWCTSSAWQEPTSGYLPNTRAHSKRAWWVAPAEVLGANRRESYRG